MGVFLWSSVVRKKGKKNAIQHLYHFSCFSQGLESMKLLISAYLQHKKQICYAVFQRHA